MRRLKAHSIIVNTHLDNRLFKMSLNNIETKLENAKKIKHQL